MLVKSYFANVKVGAEESPVKREAWRTCSIRAISHESKMDHGIMKWIVSLLTEKRNSGFVFSVNTEKQECGEQDFLKVKCWITCT
jgi:hypothetical protein